MEPYRNRDYVQCIYPGFILTAEVPTATVHGRLQLSTPCTKATSCPRWQRRMKCAEPLLPRQRPSRTWQTGHEAPAAAKLFSECPASQEASGGAAAWAECRSRRMSTSDSCGEGTLKHSTRKKADLSDPSQLGKCQVQLDVCQRRVQGRAAKDILRKRIAKVETHCGQGSAF